MYMLNGIINIDHEDLVNIHLHTQNAKYLSSPNYVFLNISI